MEINPAKAQVLTTADYYPFGSIMRESQLAGISKPRFGYQGDFSEDETETTGWNSFELRMYDGVVGRFTTVDPAGQFFSPYVGMGNVPTIGIDPTGGICPTCPETDRYASARNSADTYIYNESDGSYFMKGYDFLADGVYDEPKMFSDGLLTGIANTDIAFAITDYSLKFSTDAFLNNIASKSSYDFVYKSDSWHREITTAKSFTSSFANSGAIAWTAQEIKAEKVLTYASKLGKVSSRLAIVGWGMDTFNTGKHYFIDGNRDFGTFGKWFANSAATGIGFAGPPGFVIGTYYHFGDVSGLNSSMVKEFYKARGEWRVSTGVSDALWGDGF